MEISILGYKVELEVLILIGVIYLILVGHTVCGCSRVGFEVFTQKVKKEGYANLAELTNRPEQPVPLPEGEMLLFANTPFKPECCNTKGGNYSNSSGCACATVNQLSWMNSRGGNNVPFAEY